MIDVVSIIDISPSERERIRVDFYREHRSQHGFSSVAVRRGKATRAWYVDVSATEAITVPASFRGLAVCVKTSDGAINAVGQLAQVS